ncbi:uncharacterized protein EDB93DRAFT_1251279 [Suillus bovinus]|uniref:uncharacterized protein n=1 Tax=Suillus bovinus TaxID=48563 RepID=UPI001B85CCBF|nr:uncharacterized protein EDB93DRAFT_1251279 [Suillus bovinus]KAG2145415.1 hypothetical protein EDB93DRAFT_1251279 [Suillus bovinus]
MPELYPSPASTSDNQNSLNEYRPLTLTPANISTTMSMSASHIRASISQYQVEAANNNLPLLAWIRHFKAGLQWKITTFVMPILQYSAARNIISVIPSPIAHILHLIPGHTWNMVPDHIFSYHICVFHDIADPGDPSLIVSSHDTPWWMGETAIPNKPWQWDRVMTCCIFHYQHWLDGIENDGLTIPEQFRISITDSQLLAFNYQVLQEHLDAWAPTIFLLILLVSALASYPYPDLTLVILVILAFPFALYLSLQQSQYIWPDPFADEAYPCSVSPPD